MRTLLLIVAIICLKIEIVPYNKGVSFNGTIVDAELTTNGGGFDLTD
jgi:hypothetical protein